MAIGSQCGEDEVFKAFFDEHGTIDGGFVVDIGAADGMDNSNSWALIQKGWKGILVEPDPEQYEELHARYRDTEIDTVRTAIGTETGIFPFYSCRQVSTFSPEWRDRCIEAYGVEYTESRVAVITLQFLLENFNCPKRFDLLSIDCESRDTDVLASLDLTSYHPTLICLECGAEVPGYELYHQTSGNTIYRRVSSTGVCHANK